MADVTIETSAGGVLYTSAQRGGPFWISTTDGYVIYVDSSADLKYNKTSDGGATWGGATNIRTGTVTQFDCWADWQTLGDAGTLINIVYFDTGSNDIHYVSLDAATGIVAGDDVIEIVQGSGTFAVNTGRGASQLTITKTRGGRYAVALHYRDSASTGFYSFYTSTDADTWTSRAIPWEGTALDLGLLYPANLADNDDLWMLFLDISTNEISLKTFDDDADVPNGAWAEAAIATMVESTLYQQFDGQVRLSDGHLILAFWNAYDVATADLLVYDITDGGTITAKTNIITDEAESACVSVFINQVNDDIYVAYFSGTSFTSLVACFYQKSTDGGANWGGETAMQADAEDDERWVSAGCMKASLGGKFQPAWFNDDLDDLFTDTDNGITIAASGGGGWSGEFCGVAVAEFDGVTPAEVDGV